MKQIIALSIVMAGITSLTSSMMITLPDGSTFRNRLYQSDEKFTQLDEQVQNKIIDLLSNQQTTFPGLFSLLNTAAGHYITPRFAHSNLLEQKKILATAALESFPDTLQRMLQMLHQPKSAISENILIAKNFPCATDIEIIQLPDAAQLRLQLKEHGLEDFLNAIEPIIASCTNDAIARELIAEKIKGAVIAYHKYLVLMKKDQTKNIIESDVQTFIKLLLQNHLVSAIQVKCLYNSQ